MQTMYMGDPYDYPMPNRKDLMNLSSIQGPKDGCKTTTKSFVTNRNISTNLNTKDIEGAQPKLHGSATFTKPEFTNANLDIEGAYPRQLHFALQKPEYNLTNEDIHGTKPNIVKFKTTRIGGDPLNPAYNLPDVEKKPPTPPHFIRDNIVVNDIDGARPKKPPVYQVRDPLKIDDIDGVRTKNVQYKEYDYMNYGDVTKVDFQSKRVVNPLNPQYDLRDENGTLIKYGNVEKSCPKPVPERKKGPISLGLKTDDIIGAQASTKGLGPFADRKREFKRQLVKCDDIDGAQSGTLKKAPNTIRHTNPMNPDYQLPGNKELIDVNNPFGLTAQTVTSPYEKLKKEQEELMKQTKQNAIAHTSIKKESSNIIGDVAKFYGAPDQTTLHQTVKMEEVKSAQKSKGPPTAEVKKELPNDPSFNLNNKIFFGEAPTKEDVFDKNVEIFYKAPAVPAPNPVKVIEKKEKDIAPAVNKESGLFQSNLSKFYEARPPSSSSTGSVFQKNAAHFLGCNDPASGQKIVTKNDMAYKQDLMSKAHKLPSNKAMDPKFQGNTGKFFGSEKGPISKPVTFEEKMNKFISKAI